MMGRSPRTNRIALRLSSSRTSSGVKLPACLLVVNTEASASSPAAAVGVRIQRFPAHKLGNVFMSFLLVPPR